MLDDSDKATRPIEEQRATTDERAREQVLQYAQARDPLQLTSLDVKRITRQLRALAGSVDLRIAYAGNVTLDTLSQYAAASLASSGFTSESYVAPFGQVQQELLNPTSGLRNFQPGFLFLHFDADALRHSSPPSEASASLDARLAELEDLLESATSVVQAALEHTTATVVITNFLAPDSYALGLADARSDLGEEEFFARLNSGLSRTFRAEPRVQLFDLSRLTGAYGRSRSQDRRLYYVAKIPWQEGFLPVLADELVRHVKVSLGRVRKCLVLDLDNTLWGGVLGEDGPEGIRVGSGDAISEAHFDLQRKILAIRQRGILLAICSKNNPADVDEAFRLRPDMPLRQADFVCSEVGWDLKHEGLKRIAQRLNIGLDSLVFLDDNPAEVELIRQTLPEVECVLVPADPELRATCLDRLHSLDRALLTTEDQHKTAQYQANSKRETARDKYSTVEEYLKSLQTRITIRQASEELRPRAHQLFTKTNQFNVTTRRYSLAEIEEAASANTSRLILIRVEDRFGDLGWVGAVLLRAVNEPEVHVDSFILSCRAMGRGIETAVLNHLKEWCFGLPECNALTAEYRPTARNAPVRDLFDLHGFTRVSENDSGTRTYRLQRRDSTLTPCEWISISPETQASGSDDATKMRPP